MPLLCYAALPVAVFVGALIGAVTSGRFSVRTDMGGGLRPHRDRELGPADRPADGGGILAGFGTRMAGR
jgi:hypothetical protein